MNIKNKFFFIFIFIVFTLDRLSKVIVINESLSKNSLEIYSSKFINLILVWNEGIAFGMLSLENNIFYNLLSLFIFIVILLIIFLSTKSKYLEKYSYGMIIGGAFGNLFDRIYYKAVPDYIDFHYNGFHWFTFNVADIFITLGLIMLINLEIFKKYEKNT